MLTGRRAFDGEDITETLAAIVRGEPDWTALPGGVPPPVRELVERCLVKNRAERLSDMSVARYLLTDRDAIGFDSHQTRCAGDTIPIDRLAHNGGPHCALGHPDGCVDAGLVVRPFGVGHPQRDASEHRAAQGDSLTNVNQAPVAISPYGSTVAYFGRRGGTAQLFV